MRTETQLGSCDVPNPVNGKRKPATGPQLWRLNRLGLLAGAIEPDGCVYVDGAARLIADAVEQGLFAPRVCRPPESRL
jgi:hypothetical protein